jgi:hypothetical protein
MRTAHNIRLGVQSRHIEMDFALGGVDVEEDERVSPELFLCRLATLNLEQPADAAALQTTMQG